MRYRQWEAVSHLVAQKGKFKPISMAIGANRSAADLYTTFLLFFFLSFFFFFHSRIRFYDIHGTSPRTKAHIEWRRGETKYSLMALSPGSLKAFSFLVLCGSWPRWQSGWPIGFEILCKIMPFSFDVYTNEVNGITKNQFLLLFWWAGNQQVRRVKYHKNDDRG